MSEIPETDLPSPDPAAIDKGGTFSTEAAAGTTSENVATDTAANPATPVAPVRIKRKVTNRELPDEPHYRGNDIIPCTIENLETILAKEGFKVRYNLVKKKVEIDAPGHVATADNRDNVGLTLIINMAARYGLATGNIPAFVDVIADKHAYNPVADWIGSKPWDGIDRLPAICATVHAAPGYPEDLKITLLRKWLLSAVAAATMETGFRTRGVLVLQGDQGINKTTWVRATVSHLALRDQLVKIDHHLDVGNKDSVLGAITHWIVEIGELDSSFRKDVARLKGFLTSPTDKVRRPYAKVESEYPRRTVFAATVNDARFLVDQTGNSRWWTIPVVKLDADHKIDMQQLYAQLALEVQAGHEWWLTPQEEAQLAEINAQHQAISAVDELIRSYVDPARLERPDNPYVSASGLLRLLGIDNPNNAQSREAGATLRELCGKPSKIKGTYKWRFPGTLNEDGTAMLTPAQAAQNAIPAKWQQTSPVRSPPPAPCCSPPAPEREY
jgi:putative DNA primase/helicase